MEVFLSDHLFTNCINQESSFGKYFADTKHLIQTPVSDRFELVISTDVEAATELQDMWKI